VTPGRRSLVWRLRRVWYLVGLLAVGGASGIGYVLAQVPLPEVDRPVETTFLYDTAGNKLAELSGGENRVSVRLGEVSPHLVAAVLAGEDRDFFRHPGVDAGAIARATLADLRGKPLQGGSTITQQYVKDTYVGDERSLARKLKEAVLAVKLERKLDKREILERYLNTVYFGRGAYGVQAAARAYYFTSVDQLDVRQSAFLAGLIRAPEAADPTTHPRVADRRRDLVLGAMLHEHVITAAEAAAARAQPVSAWTRPRGDVVHDRYVDAQYGTPYVVEHVRRQLHALGFTDAQINGGGLRVTTSLDLHLQEAAYRAVYTDTLNRPGDPAGALVAIDTGGWVRAMVGGRDWDADTPYARVNFATGRDGGGTGRQPGSSFKPVALAAAVDAGYTAESAFDAPATMTFPKADDGKDYKVSNFQGEAFGRLNLIDATKVSANTVYAQLVDAIGPARVAGMAARLGITTEVPPLLSIALGTPLVSVLDMADAYLTFATRGVQVAPGLIEQVTDTDGHVLYERATTSRRVIQARTADVVTWALRQVVAGGTGTRAQLPVDAAGKTGTTQAHGDAWFVGYTPGLSTAVWMGYPEGQAHGMDHVHGIQVTGGSLPAEAWRRFMAVATRDGRYAGSFGPPPDLSAGRVLAGSDRVAATSSTTSSTSSTTTTTVGTGSTSTTSTTSTSTTAPPSPSTTASTLLP
jgi:penicillin-binding protein 1A